MYSGCRRVADAAFSTQRSRIASASVGLSSWGHFDRCCASSTCCSAVRGSCLCSSHRRNSRRVAPAKFWGKWCIFEASLIDQACRPLASKRGWRGPPPSVVRRHGSGSSLRGVAPCPLQYKGQ
eukprot:679981-Pleurochrysis_carterae.AAC.5